MPSRLQPRPRGIPSPAVLLTAAMLTAPAGCRYEVDWPADPVETRQESPNVDLRSYRIGRTAGPNYAQRLVGGRVSTLLFDDNADGQTDETVDLTTTDSQAQHFLIVLDGVPFDVVATMHRDGRFRLFGPPARVITVFPSMTDLALSRLFRTKPCIAPEALYFDRSFNRLSDGNRVYLGGENAPWMSVVDYHAPQDVAVGVYLNPSSVFSRELRDIQTALGKTPLSRYSAYSVGTAGLGTRGGEAAVRSYLLQVEKLCERLTYEKRGRIRFSLTADHGHTLQRCRLVDFRGTLAAAGFDVTKSLQGPNDVVPIYYGLVTYALFYTHSPTDVAEALLTDPAVELATYLDGGAVVVRTANEKAVINKVDSGFSYDASEGDPLDLRALLDDLRTKGHVTADGVISDQALLVASAEQRYPDPLHRLWDCFHGLVEKPADVVVSLKPDACHGSKFFHFFVAPVASTHGDLEKMSSTSFLLTNAVGDLPAVMRVEDALDAIAWQAPSKTEAPGHGALPCGSQPKGQSEAPVVKTQ